MLTECFNPDCRTELRYLRSGRVVRVLSEDMGQITVEHFWLCGACYLSHDFRFGEDGKPDIVQKSVARVMADLTNVLDTLNLHDGPWLSKNSQAVKEVRSDAATSKNPRD